MNGHQNREFTVGCSARGHPNIQIEAVLPINGQILEWSHGCVTVDGARSAERIRTGHSGDICVLKTGTSRGRLRSPEAVLTWRVLVWWTADMEREGDPPAVLSAYRMPKKYWILVVSL
jgi:hypothetical protein